MHCMCQWPRRAPEYRSQTRRCTRTRAHRTSKCRKAATAKLLNYRLSSSKAGGFVEFNRVNGNLALSRAFGDFAFKNHAELPAESQMISSKPDVVIRPVDEDLMFVVLACDGIWDVMSNQEVADFVISKLATGMEPEIICEELMMRCLAPDSSMGGLGCDNMTVILVCFLHNQPYQK